MNPLLQQFLVEARDYLDQIDHKLLLLEEAPEDDAIIGEIFRLVHTLKGNSGLFDMPSLTIVLHAAEDVLDRVRDHTLLIDPELTDALLAALDFVNRLLDDVEATGAVPARYADDASELAGALRDRLPERSETGDDPSRQACAPLEPPADWFWLSAIPDLERLEAFERLAPDENAVAVRYRPEPDCFFKGEDPLQLLRTTPGLLLFDIGPAEPWPEPDSLDVYRANLVVDALTSASLEEIERHFRYVRDQTAIYEIPRYALALPEASLAIDSTDMIASAFLDEARRLTAAADWRGLSAAAEAALDVINPTRACVSALRWIMKIAGSTDRADIVEPLIAATVGGPARPDWRAVSVAGALRGAGAPLAERAISDRSNSSDETAVSYRALALAQIEMLSLSTTVAEQPGRIASVRNALCGLLTSAGRTDALDELDRTAAACDEHADASGLVAFIRSVVLNEEAAASVKPALAVAGGGNSSEPLDAREAAPLSAKRFAAEPSPTDRGVRVLKVGQEKVDRLMDLIGEMVVAKNALPYLAARAEVHYGSRELSREIKAQYAIINRIAEEMQDGIMQVRMLPVGAIFQRFPRLVRDVARQLGKSVRLTIEGEETEADKNIVESLADPMIHILRNSLDHGLEPPDVRRAAGKPEEGRLTVRAFQEGDRVLIEVEDDGKGIDPEVIKRKALEKGLIDEQRLETLADTDAIQLVFAAGFSTAEQISSLSGRGVGMDVVKSSLEKVGGQVQLTSEKGKGARILLSLPLSISVSNVMMVDIGGQHYGVPIDVVVETVRVARKDTHVIKQHRTAVLRGRVVPLYSAYDLLGSVGDPAPNADDEFAVLVARVAGHTVGVIVDGFAQTIDVILKPLEGPLAHLTGFSGSALLGDGSVLLVIDLKELI
ncbi:chemotaxis protein CheA [Methylosinus sp. Sm6]|uniref:chemotaxis protein CheA n=1 Tax=Methylosinus sp. Sm6 TaxID=2866948 RepID=UPI001C9A074E|nr:chemotaxis protein CheA [Methylosinus sp. Sm6]